VTPLKPKSAGADKEAAAQRQAGGQG